MTETRKDEVTQEMLDAAYKAWDAYKRPANDASGYYAMRDAIAAALRTAPPIRGADVDTQVEAWKRELSYDLGNPVAPMMEVNENKLVTLLASLARTHPSPAQPNGVGARCEFCAGTIDHHATGCDAVHQQEGAPRGKGKAVAIIASEISDAIDAHDSGENVNATQRAAHVLNALLPEMNDYWHNGYTEGKKDAAPLAAERGTTHDYTKDADDLVWCIRDAAHRIREGADDNGVWLTTLEAHAIVAVQDAAVLASRPAVPAEVQEATERVQKAVDRLEREADEPSASGWFAIVGAGHILAEIADADLRTLLAHISERAEAGR